MNSSEDFGSSFSEDWHNLDLYLSSGYEQEDNFRGQLGQAQAQYDSDNLSLEPDDLELGPSPLVGGNTFPKRHTMPPSQCSPSTNIKGLAQLASNSPKRAETYPSTLEGPNIARNQRLLEDLLSKIDPGTASASSESNNRAADTTNVAQSLPVGREEWPVPTFLLDLIDGPTPPGFDRDLTLDEIEKSPKPFTNIQSQDIEHTQTNDCYSMAEDFDSVPPPSFHYHKATLNSDSGIGSSIMRSINGGSQAKGSVMFDKGGIYGGTAPGFYQKAAAMGPLKTPASCNAPSVATQPTLSDTALQTMKEIILDPIRKDTKFRDFWHICSMAWEQMITGQIGSLRDLEKFLFHKASSQQNNQAYDIFCKEFLSHVKESLKYMPEDELLRSYDRPYDRGYFLDIMARFSKSTMNEDFELTKWLHSTKSQPEKRVADTPGDDTNYVKRVKVNDQMSFGHSGYGHAQYREPSLMGPPPLPASVLKSANPPITAHLVRTGRTRARRRGSGQQKEPLLHRCEWPNCQHEPFTRACDLTKHQKTHTRPHKCSLAGCKYATQGFPTEKERDRHWVDKHSSDTPSYSCLYHPCTYKSKRDSNCKQHMEKAHGYTYVRMKQNYKTNSQKRLNATPTSPTSQGSPTGSSPAKPDSPVTNAPQIVRYQTTGSQPTTMTGFCPGGMKEELYSVGDLEKLRSYLIQYNQPDAHEQNLMANFGSQGFAQGGAGILPYPVIEDPGFIYIPMPDANIDPSLPFIDIGALDGTMDLDTGEEQGLTSYSDTVT